MSKRWKITCDKRDEKIGQTILDEQLLLMLLLQMVMRMMWMVVMIRIVIYKPTASLSVS